MRTKEEINELKNQLEAIKSEIKDLVENKRQALEGLMSIQELLQFGQWIMAISERLQIINVVFHWLSGEEVEMKPGEADLPTFMAHVQNKLSEIYNQLPVEGKLVLPASSKLVLP